jgi:trigger factor
MKYELFDITETQKNLVVEIPGDAVDAEVARLAEEYSRTARVPGFRVGKVPLKVARQRFRDQILHEAAHELVPRAVDRALRERGLDPIDTPEIRDVVVEESKPLTFTATFETVPPIDPGDVTTVALRRHVEPVGDEAVEHALGRLRDRAARFEPIEGRPAEFGDTVAVDLERTPVGAGGAASGAKDRHEGVSIEIGAPANPPGLDAEIVGLDVGASKTFRLTFPADYAVQEMAGTSVEYAITVRAIRRRVLPALDDEFARDLGEFDSLAALRARVRQDLEAEAAREADRAMRADLLRHLAARVTFEAPASLVDREVTRRLEDFTRELGRQGIDPAEMKIDWEDVRERQKGAAAESVKSALVLDEVARRDQIAVSDEEVEAEVARYAERTGRTPAAVRARIEKEGGLARLYAGLRREKTIDHLLSRATIVSA